jgi:hypothetical protein
MRPARKISRRSFLARIGGASVLALGGCTMTGPIDEDPHGPPRRRPPRRPRESCTDGDSGRHVDPPGRGRHCRFGEGGRRPRN